MDEAGTSSDGAQPLENGFALASEIKRDLSSAPVSSIYRRVPPPPPDPADDSWQEITKNFKEAAATLQLGELVHESSFSLFEGMSAIELMDPKMDAGMLQRSQTKPVTFSSAVESGQLRLSNIPSTEQIAIMDASMASLLTWLEGHSLAQTVFTNLYTHKPYDIEDRTLKAFIVGILRLIAVCGDVIQYSYVSEEEDFQPTTYGFFLCSDLSDTRVLGMLKEASDDCQKAIRHIKSEPVVDDSQIKMDRMEALSARIKTLRLLLVSIFALTCNEKNMANSGRSFCFEDAQPALEQCKELIERIAATAALGLQIPENDAGQYSGLPCFVSNVNQRLLPPTFPRKARLLSPTAAFQYLRRLVHQLLLICTLPDRVASFATALEFFRDFAKKDSCFLSRAILQVAYSSDRGSVVLGKVAFVDTVKEAMLEFIQPPVLHAKSTLANDPQCREAWESFLNNCCRDFPELLKCYGYNRARQRDRLAVALEDLASLQEEAERLDGVLHSILNRSNQPVSITRHHLMCLGSFVLNHVLVTMLDYLLLGFELELYSVHEYAYVYWYAHEFLYKWLVNILHKADNFIYEQDQANSKCEKTKDKKKKAAKKKPPKMHRLEIVNLQSKQKLCEGYYKMMLGFYALKRIRVPSFAGNSDHDCVLYEHRLAPFAHLTTPPMIGYNQFLSISNFKEIIENVPANRLFSDAAQCFEEARLGLENVPSSDENENAILVRISKMNVVILRLLASGHRSDAKNWPIFDFQLHCNFPVVRLK